MDIAGILSRYSETDFEEAGQRAIDAGEVKGEDGFREGGSVARWDEAGRSFYASGVAAGRIAELPKEPPRFIYDRNECLSAAFREGLVKIDELTADEKLMVLRDQNSRLKASATPAAPAAAPRAFAGGSGQKKYPPEASIIRCGGIVEFR